MALFDNFSGKVQRNAVPPLKLSKSHLYKKRKLHFKNNKFFKKVVNMLIIRILLNVIFCNIKMTKQGIILDVY